MTISTSIDEQYANLEKDLVKLFQENGDLAVIQAPPGSGKTFMLLSVISELVNKGMRIALSAQTNNQADDIVKRWARDYPKLPITRFASKDRQRGADIPLTVNWVIDKDELPDEAGVCVSTTAKWTLTSIANPYDLLAVDEAWQMGWGDLIQCAELSRKFFLIGDPGQIPPVVSIDARRWDTARRPPHKPAPEVVIVGVVRFG